MIEAISWRDPFTSIFPVATPTPLPPMNEIKQITTKLFSSLVPIKEIVRFSGMPGIYAVGYLEENFPLKGADAFLDNHPIVYIGKTESSSLKRDKNTHFASGKTGSSTVRRSLGAILREQLSLVPIPRSVIRESDTKKQKERKYRFYKFELDGEVRLSGWMNKNLSLSFWEFDGYQIDRLRSIEKRIIQQYGPLLNLNHNPTNPYRSKISSLRKECSALAKTV